MSPPSSQTTQDYLKGRNDNKSLKHTRSEAGKNPTRVAELSGLRILEGALEKSIGSHSKSVFEGEVSGEGGQALPQRPHALRTINGGATVDDPLVGAGGVELQPGLNDVNRLQATRLHNSSDGARKGFHVRRNRGFLLRLRHSSTEVKVRVSRRRTRMRRMKIERRRIWMRLGFFPCAASTELSEHQRGQNRLLIIWRGLRLATGPRVRTRFLKKIDPHLNNTF